MVTGESECVCPVSSDLRHRAVLFHICRNNTESAELVSHYESSLSLPDILPIPSKTYDKNRAPKLLGQPTVDYFHVTVLSLDSINEESMVSRMCSSFQYSSLSKH